MIKCTLYYKVFNAGRARRETGEFSCLKGAIDYGVSKYGTNLQRITYFDTTWWRDVGHWYNPKYMRPEGR